MFAEIICQNSCFAVRIMMCLYVCDAGPYITPQVQNVLFETPPSIYALRNKSEMEAVHPRVIDSPKLPCLSRQGHLGSSVHAS